MHRVQEMSLNFSPRPEGLGLASRLFSAHSPTSKSHGRSRLKAFTPLPQHTLSITIILRSSVLCLVAQLCPTLWPHGL